MGVRALKMNGSRGLGGVLGTVEVMKGPEPKNPKERIFNELNVYHLEIQWIISVRNKTPTHQIIQCKRRAFCDSTNVACLRRSSFTLGAQCTCICLIHQTAGGTARVLHLKSRQAWITQVLHNKDYLQVD